MSIHKLSEIDRASLKLARARQREEARFWRDLSRERDLSKAREAKSCERDQARACGSKKQAAGKK